MKQFFPICALFIAVTSSIAQAATGDSATLNVTAQLSAPICSFEVTGDGQNAGTNTVDLGKINPLTLNQTPGEFTELSVGSPRIATATVLCDAKTNVTIDFKDANSDAGSNIDLDTTPSLITLSNLLHVPTSFALMMDGSSTPVGRFSLALAGLSSQTMAAFGDNTDDLTAAYILRNGVSTAGSIFPIKTTDTLTFSKYGATPAPLKKLLLKVRVDAAIVKDAIATADQVNISGQAIVNVKYL